MPIPYLDNLVQELKNNSRITHWIREPSLVPTQFTPDPGSYIRSRRAPLRALYAQNFTKTMAKRGGALLAVNYTGAFQRSMVSFLQTPVIVMGNEVLRDAAQRGAPADIYTKVVQHITFLLS